MNILICDDDISVMQSIKKNILLNSTTTHCVVCVDTQQKLFDLIDDTQQLFDIIIIDICLIECNGIDVAYYVEKKQPGIKIIFITGYDGYCEKIFVKVKPFAFLRKPINTEMLKLHISRIEEIVNQRKSNRFVVDSKSIKASIPYGDILYFESQKRIISIHTITDKFSFYGKLDDIEKEAPDCFLRCHKSYLVNGYYIRSEIKARSEITVINGEKIKVSRSHLYDIKECLLKIEGGLL